MSKQPPTVFISYAHEGDMSERIKALADYLLDNGIQPITDHPYTNIPPTEGWTVWMQHNIEDADFVLVVCTGRYKALFEKRGVADEGGRGVIWEGAILNSGLYEEKLQNSRIFPILPDDGEHSDVPAILKAWHNNHRFPSKNANILQLITETVTLPEPTQIFQTRLKGELNENHPRLNPREGEVFGREDECNKIIEFLDGNNPRLSVCGHVTGSAGIGKTEVCKAALKTWLAHSETRCFWVPVPDDSDVAQFNTQLGDAVGFDAEKISTLVSNNSLYHSLPKGLYYLDNLESLAESDSGQYALRELSQIPDIRLLASSRRNLDELFGDSIDINRLALKDATELFIYCWKGGKELDRQAVEIFVDEQLGGHALSITLLARHGKYYLSWEKFLQKWQEKSTALEKVSNDRISSLEKSLSLTEDLLAENPNALDLWQFISLFDDGINEDILDAWQAQASDDMAMIMLIDHSLVTKVDDRYTLLPPMARYALNPQRSNTALTPHLNWLRTRENAYRYFVALSAHASDIVSSDENIQSRQQSGQQLFAIAKLCQTDINFGELLKPVIANALQALGDLESRLGNLELARENYEKAIGLYEQEQDQLGLANAFMALGDLELSLNNVELTRENYLKSCLFEKDQLGFANALYALGDLELQLGNLELARENYEKAIGLYEQEQDQLGLTNALGLANALQRLGDFSLGKGQWQDAKAYYQNALEHYRNEAEPMGTANMLAKLIRCEHQLNNNDSYLLGWAQEALIAAERSGVEPLKGHVIRAMYKALDEDEEKLKQFLQSLYEALDEDEEQLKQFLQVLLNE